MMVLLVVLVGVWVWLLDLHNTGDGGSTGGSAAPIASVACIHLATTG